MQKGIEHATKKWHDRHSQKLKERRIRNHALKLEHMFAVSSKGIARKRDKIMQRIAENWERKPWYSKLLFKLRRRFA